jgi:hypothetical protein
MSRTSFLELPSAADLKTILAMESQRAVPADNVGRSFVDLAPGVRVLDMLGVPSAVLSSSDDPERWFADFGLPASAQVLGDCVARMAERTWTDEERAMLLAAYDHLAEEDAPRAADAVVVFGAKTMARIEEGVRLYQAGLAPLLVVSGGRPAYAPADTVAEARRYAEYAIAQGVPTDAILVEDESISVPDNAKRTLDLLDARGLSYRTLLLVNSPYVQRRGWAHLRKFAPPGTDVLRRNCAAGPAYRRDTWYQSEEGVRAVLNEYGKMKVAAVLGTA